MTRQAVQDTEALRTALRTADIVPQLLVEAQLSGKSDLLAEAAPHINGAWSFQESIPEDLRSRIQSRLIATLQNAANDAAPLIPPSLARLSSLMSVGAGEPIPNDYVAMMMEEIVAIVGEDPRSVSWRTTQPPAHLERFKVAIIGAGLSGICMGIKLKEIGVPFVIFEKNEDLGGTWFENSYPGCGVDIPNHYYSFSFAPKPDWSRHFASRDELWTYLKDCVDRWGIRGNIRFRAHVIGAVYDEASRRWSVTVSGSDGAQESIQANILISGVGQLNRPAIPNIPGLSEFPGPAFHTAQWDHSIDLTDKRVALIGTGASSIQVGPAIADRVKKLLIFQRSPPWASVNLNYHRTVVSGMIWALKFIPYFAQWHRILLSWASSDGLHASLQIDPNWKFPDQSVSEGNHRLRESLIAHIHGELGDRPDLIEKVTPAYPPYGKRMLRDNHWYKTLRRDNVELVVSGVKSVSGNTLIDNDGGRHDADVIVFATGFQTMKMLASIDIRGRGGQSIRVQWGDEDPRAYLGISVVGFPNFFILYGPNTSLSHGGSLFFHAECQVRYVMQCIRELIETGHDAMECRPAPFNEYNRRVDEAHSRMVWVHPAVTSWYKNSQGRVITNSPWRLVDYWKLTYSLNPSDYLFE
jgi:4-hydroxyacetophenone monooxygenase